MSLRATLALLPLLAGLALSGCMGEMGGCAASVEYRGPAIRIASARRAETGVAISQVILRDFSVDGRAIPAEQVASLIDPGTSTGVTAKDGTLVCNVPCAFGNTPGTYRFVVSATQHQPTPVTAEAFTREIEDCPLTIVSDVQLALELSAQE